MRQLQPQTVVLGHWESFFRSPDRPLRICPRRRPNRMGSGDCDARRTVRRATLCAVVATRGKLKP